MYKQTPSLVLQSTFHQLFNILEFIIMKSTAQLPIRLITHNIRYATTSPFEGEKPWTERRPLIHASLAYNTLYIPESFICLQEVLHQQILDVMDDLNGLNEVNKSKEEWAYIGVGRDDGMENGEYSPIIFRPRVWKVLNWKTFWLSETPEKPGKGWDAASVRIVTVGTFKHRGSGKQVVGMSTHFDDQGVVSRRESAKLILEIIDSVTKSPDDPTASTGSLPVFLAGDLNSEVDEEAYQILNAEDSSLEDVRGLPGVMAYGEKNTFTGFDSTDFTLSNPDTLTKYKVAAQISQKVLQEVSGWCVEGAKIVELCERGDKLLEEEVSKVYKGKTPRVPKGIGHCTTVSPSAYITPYTPLKTDAEEAETTLKAGECVKIQLGAQVDGLPAIVCDSIIVPAAEKDASGEITGREADLLLATHYANELLLRLMVPPGLVPHGTEEEQKKAASQKPPTQSKMTQLLEKITSAYDCNLVESTTIWLFEHNEIEAKKKIILAPGESVKGEGIPEVGEVWGVEMGVSLGSGKVKNISNRATLHRRTATTYGLKRPTSRALLSEVVKKFGTFPFSLRQLDDEKAAKIGVMECVRGGVLRQYEVVGDKNNDPVARLFTTVAITKNGLTRLAAPPTPDLSKWKSDKKITDEEVLKILEQPLGKAPSDKKKNRKKRTKKPKKAEATEGAEEEEESDEDVRMKMLALWTRLIYPERVVSINQGPSRNQRAHKLAVFPAAMPALRKRQSRTSTPHDTPNDTPPHDPESRRGKTQSFLDSWIEPPPKNPAPSFEEHGFARHGVLENMVPLGVPPNNKARNRARLSGEWANGRSSFGKKTNGLFGDEGASTPEMTPAPEPEQDDSERIDDEDDIGAASAPRDDDDDGEYVPKKAKPKAYVAKTPVRGKTPVANKTPVQGRTPLRNSSRPTTAVASPATQPITPSPFDDVTRQRTHIAVNAAIDRSNTGGKKSVGHAIRELWGDTLKNTSLAETLHSIMQQNATMQQFTLFKNYIKEKKKEYKRRDREDVDMKSPPLLPESNLAAFPRTTTVSVAQDMKSAAPLVLETADLPRHDHEEDVPHVEVSFFDPEPTPVATSPIDATATLPASGSSSPPAVELPSKSPRKRSVIANGNAAPGSGLSTNAHTPAPESADSDLSDVNEEIVQNGPPEPVRVNGHGTAALPKKAKNAALARAGKKSRANSVKPPGKYEKKPPPTAEELAEQFRIQRRRQELVEQQPSYLGYNPPTSDVRFDDEMLETESLTESQIAVGPPVHTNQPRQPGRVPRNTNGMSINIGKRLRDNSSAQPSPRLESAASTRPSTPAIAPPFPKRLKLNNGQAARTKRSPVKNRDGPIAGIPHLGGGGSRQSGPDDNAPGSPPVDSDDFCSACKGAGEFVCCDYCPRVFHFLCCDPPRKTVPEGHFSCFECAVEHKPAEESPDSWETFVPLFKQLEHTNTRAFALPSDVQNYFEDVSARLDGSYFEDIKKFPLSKNSGYGYQKPDYLKTTDSDHKVILCTQCGKSSGSKRQMLKCDFCHTHWHLDCCDPPLANPPHISLDAAQRDAWRCPRHIEHDLRSGNLLQHDLNVRLNDDVAFPDGRIARKVRKPKNANIVEPTFSRGMRNNGLITVINDPDDDTDGEGNYVFASDESCESRDLNSKIFRVPEKGIVLDFLSKVKSNRIEKQKEAHRAAKIAAKRRASMAQFAAHPIESRQAATHLVTLANKEKDIGLDEYTVEALILRLTAEAPKEVVCAMSNAGPPVTTPQEREQLQKLQELINRRLATSD
ncbi:hypothetical protein K504DRAFT_375359 [Pleomassaria siparia CBS 279.74]|uniref:PHD-type domain-containing protein n=1 Tax=Pleomassaria siparia CBS 279.74 TaxID=1314801 RepID=A0A6G1KFT0_9PLEO|nr:hypothetical protein K504DRAFT_375359 [Pleomassaria siparia CBS 279.74]